MIRDVLLASHLLSPVSLPLRHNFDQENWLSAHTLMGEGCADVYRPREINPRADESAFWEALLNRQLIPHRLYSLVNARIENQSKNKFSSDVINTTRIPFSETA